MSDLRERIDVAAGLAADKSWGSAESGKGMMADAVAAAVEAILPIIEADFEEERQNTVVCSDCGKLARPGCNYSGHGLVELSELLDWFCNPTSENELRVRLTEANKLLEQTIEVLEDYWHDRRNHNLDGWWGKAKPLLDNLKAREKNHGSA